MDALNIKGFLLYSILCLLWFTSLAGVAAADSIKLVGSAEKEQGLIASKANVVVAKFISFSSGGLDRLGGVDYEGGIEVTSSMQGSLSGRILVGYVVADWETDPKLDTAYIMFVAEIQPHDWELLKLLPASADNIERIKKLIAQSRK